MMNEGLWLARRGSNLGLALALVLAVAPASVSSELALETYLDLIDRYRHRNPSHAARALLSIDPDDLSERNLELPRVLDLSRRDDARTLRAAVLLSAEAALAATDPSLADWYLDEAVRVTTLLPAIEGVALQKKVHLAAAYRLYHERRIVDALRVLTPAALRYPSDPELQFAVATLEEISGWLNASHRHLREAEASYRQTITLAPSARATLRLGRVLVLLGRRDEAERRLRAGLTGDLRTDERVVGLLALGDAVGGEIAQQYYRKALELDPECQAAYVALARALRQEGRFEDALQVTEDSFTVNARAMARDSFGSYLLGDSASHRALWRELRESVR